jgi:hypothetical protein
MTTGEIANIEPSATLLDMIDEFLKSGIKTKDLLERIKQKATQEGIPNFLLIDIIRGIMRKKGLTERQIRYNLTDKYANGPREVKKNADNNEVEESNNTINTDDSRSENMINDEVNKSMNASEEDDIRQEKDFMDYQANRPPIKTEGDIHLATNYQEQREGNRIKFELQREIELLRQQLENKEGINELLKREIEESKTQAGQLATDAEEIVEQLKLENEQLRHALTKKSFESAAEVKEKIGNHEIENLTNYIKQLEQTNSERYDEITKLNKQIESFSRLNHVVQPQPLELDLTDHGGFLSQFFLFRGKKVWILHNGQKITNVRLGGDIK